MGTRAFVSTCVAVALILVGIVLPAAYGHWLAKRTFVALDIPVSLSRGHIRTDEFYINLREQYLVDVNADYPFTYRPDCPMYGPESVLKTHVTLSREGRVLGETDGLHYFFIAYFDADKKGHYRLDIDVLSDASCLNDGHPRIVVTTGSGFYRDLYEAARWMSLIPVLGGLGLLFRAPLVGAWNRHNQVQRLGILETSGPEYRSWPPRSHAAKRVLGLPSFGLICATLWSFLLMSLLAVHSNQVARGIWVSISKHPSPNQEASFSEPPLLIRLEDAGPALPPRLYLGSVLVSWEELKGALKVEIKRRPEWVVYVDADPNVSWGDVVNVIDAIRGLNASPVLLTTGPPTMPAP
jgi:biopolymer transport protein ExbD